PAGGAYVRGAAAPPDREPRLARQTEGAGGGRGRSVGSHSADFAGAPVLRIAWIGARHIQRRVASYADCEPAAGGVAAAPAYRASAKASSTMVSRVCGGRTASR